MIKVIQIKLLIILSVIFLIGCQQTEQKQPTIEFKLPDKIDIPTFGTVSHITAEALLDSLTNNSSFKIYFIKESDQIDLSTVPTFPGIEHKYLGDFYQLMDRLTPGKTIYVACMYGDDSRRMTGELAKRGVNSVYLDGGTFRLTTHMKSIGRL